MITAKKYCPNCFCILNQSDTVCHECQFTQSFDTNAIYLSPPFRLKDQYIIGRVLGHGGFGITYLAYDRNLRVKVAVKEYLPSEFATRNKDGQSVVPLAGKFRDLFQQGKKKFIAEARLLASYRSPNIIKIRQFFEENNTGYFVMEYLEGQTLPEYMESKGGKLTVSETIKIITPLLSALEEVHYSNVFHRDIKPDNIYMTQNAEPILLDFGAARQHMTERTTNLLALVTPGFAPLEQYSLNGILGPWSDIYATAATVYFMLTGETPPDAQARMFANSPLIPPSELGVDISPENEAWLLKGLELKWSQRPDSIQMWQSMLHVPQQSVKLTQSEHEKSLKENFLKIAILPRLEEKVLTYKHEEEIYSSAAYMEIPLSEVRDLIETALQDTGSTRVSQNKTLSLEQREKDLQKKAEELRHFEELRQKEEALWWEAEQAALDKERQKLKEEQAQKEKEAALKAEELQKKVAELQHFEELRQKEEEMWWNAEQERLDKERQKFKEEQAQKEKEAREREEYLLKMQAELEKEKEALAHRVRHLEFLQSAQQSAFSGIKTNGLEEIENISKEELEDLIAIVSGKTPDKKVDLDQYYAQKVQQMLSTPPKLVPSLFAGKQKPPQVTNRLGMSFVLIEPFETGASFQMGPCRITLTQAFYLQTTPVTQTQWNQIMGNNPAHFHQNPMHPVEQVSWDDCQLFIHFLNQFEDAVYRLPWEAEWQFVAQAFPRVQTQSKSTRPVGQPPRSPQGVFDLDGNVREWVQDSYAPLQAGEYTDFRQTLNVKERVVCGRSWESPETGNEGKLCRSEAPSHQRSQDIGFRLIISPKI